MVARHVRLPIACLLAVLIVAGCGPAATQPESSPNSFPADATPSLPLATIIPTAISPRASSGAGSPLATPAPLLDLSASVLATPGAVAEALQLVVLHTNDNWGETEPSG
jgi:hypothetical protein